MNDLFGGLSWAQVWNAIKSFKYFVKHILPLSIDGYKEAPHLLEWADILEKYNRTVILAPRGHLKSTLMYAYVMWRILQSYKFNGERWLYISFKQEMAQYHVKNIKKMVEANPIFENLYDFTDAEYIARYGWSENVASFDLQGVGITSFKRGWHGKGVIADDILADPAQELNPTTIKRVSRIFFEDIIFLPHPEGYLHVVGTPQHSEDLFFQLKEKKELGFKWFRFPAIIDEKNKKVLWPQQWDYDKLITIRTAHPRAFQKEMMVEPVWETGAFLNRQKLYACVVDREPFKFSLQAKELLKNKVVVGGWDIGKKAHPSYVCVFMEDQGKLKMIWEKWMDGVDYNIQLERVKEVLDVFSVKRMYYDATRGELEAYREQGQLPKALMPLVFTKKEKFSMATLLEEVINSEKIEILNNTRTIHEMLKVNGELEAYESETGHGDSFWGIAMAVKAWKEVSSWVFDKEDYKKLYDDITKNLIF